MELFLTVLTPSQATSLCNMPGHHHWGGQEVTADFTSTEARGTGGTGLSQR